MLKIQKLVRLIDNVLIWKFIASYTKLHRFSTDLFFLCLKTWILHMMTAFNWQDDYSDVILLQIHLNTVRPEGRSQIQNENIVQIKQHVHVLHVVDGPILIFNSLIHLSFICFISQICIYILSKILCMAHIFFIYKINFAKY